MIIFLAFSCKAKRPYLEAPYKILKTEDYSDFSFLTYTKNNDTIMAVMPLKTYLKCPKSKLEQFNDTNYKKVSAVGIEKIIIHFYYKIKTNKGIEIKASDFAPGQLENMIYSYKNFPYFINDCEPYKLK